MALLSGNDVAYDCDQELVINFPQGIFQGAILVFVTLVISLTSQAESSSVKWT